LHKTDLVFQYRGPHTWQMASVSRMLASNLSQPQQLLHPCCRYCHQHCCCYSTDLDSETKARAPGRWRLSPECWPGTCCPAPRPCWHQPPAPQCPQTQQWSAPAAAEEE
jgi:hypothetical protein